MKIFFATDHAGYKLKSALIEFALLLGHEVVDCGATEYDELDDYPDYIQKAAAAVAEANDSKEVRAIIFGGSGQGEAICANRFPGVRAALYYGGDSEIVRLSRYHNDSNILSLGARFMAESEAQAAVKLWLDTLFSDDERHKRRLEKLEINTHVQ